MFVNKEFPGRRFKSLKEFENARLERIKEILKLRKLGQILSQAKRVRVTPLRRNDGKEKTS